MVESLVEVMVGFLVGWVFFGVLVDVGYGFYCFYWVFVGGVFC